MSDSPAMRERSRRERSWEVPPRLWLGVRIGLSVVSALGAVAWVLSRFAEPLALMIGAQFLMVAWDGLFLARVQGQLRVLAMPGWAVIALAFPSYFYAIAAFSAFAALVSQPIHWWALPCAVGLALAARIPPRQFRRIENL